MSGDTDNVSLWPNADVLIGPLTADDPDDGEDFTLTGDDAWAFAGILDGSAGFTESQTSDGQDFFGWGVGTIATGRRNLVITRTFTALEDNEQTLGLRYDVSGVTFSGTGYTGELAGRDLQRKFKLALQLQQGATLKRQICKNYVQIDTLGDVTEGEDAILSLPVTVKIYPDIDPDTGKAVYWSTYKGPVVVTP